VTQDRTDVRSLRPLLLSLLGDKHSLQRLQNQRVEITEEINSLVAEFGPKMWENFADSRMMPQATSPRGSAPTADSSVLSHPVAWLDNRIFGWSRRDSASMAWRTDDDKARSPRSEPSTAPGSPHESDDEIEADVDYDDVLAVLDSRGRAGASPRKRAGRSYSDLANLRAGISPEAAMPSFSGEAASNEVEAENADGLHHRKPFGNGGGADALGLDKGE
jgi:glycerol-3-phosphate O-acyltransferase/dihydroxyacetone phosphate acyltransferase